MPYDFQTIKPDRNTDCLVYERLNGLGFTEAQAVPFGVAEMMFPTAPEILEALHRTAENAYFGYRQNEKPFRQAICAWMEKKGVALEEAHIVPTHGVVAALGFAIRALSKEGDGVMIQPPVYGPFARLVRENGRRLVENRLVLQNGRYEMDFSDMEEKLRAERPALFLLCSPHNPVGRVWERETLERLRDLCAQYGTEVLADEIHQDILPFGGVFTPYVQVDPGALAMSAASKTFDIAGLSQGYTYCRDEGKRARFHAQLARDGGECLNPFGMAATAAAYTHCEAWMEEMFAQVRENIRYMETFINGALPALRMQKVEGTYLCWLDMRALGTDEAQKAALLARAGFEVTDGLFFGAGGEMHIRVNAACPKACLEAGLLRLQKAIEAR